MDKNTDLSLIPKYEKYMQYVLEFMMKLPRTEKFSIGSEFKSSMYQTMRYILYVNRIDNCDRLSYLSKIDAELMIQRIFLRIMLKEKWIDQKKFDVSMQSLYELGKILGGLIKFYGKNNKKSI